MGTFRLSCNLVCFLFIFSTFTHSLNLSTISKSLNIWTLEIKTYELPSNESLTLFGAKERKFMTNSFYIGQAGYGAISGKRSGYLEGGFILGHMPVNQHYFYDLRLFLGAGGGGSAPQGGGLIIHPTIGFGFSINKQYSMVLDIGYLKFLNGDIESFTIATNINIKAWELTLNNE